MFKDTTIRSAVMQVVTQKIEKGQAEYEKESKELDTKLQSEIARLQSERHRDEDMLISRIVKTIIP